MSFVPSFKCAICSLPTACLRGKFAELERKVSSHDQAIVGILKAIRELMHPPLPKKRPIGFMAHFDE
jgi:hypothetical protein